MVAELYLLGDGLGVAAHERPLPRLAVGRSRLRLHRQLQVELVICDKTKLWFIHVVPNIVFVV